MRTLFSKILLAQVVAVALALIVMTVITRSSLNQGFKEFLERQETAILQTLAPVLSEYYETRESWSALQDDPQAWQRVWRLTRSQQRWCPASQATWAARQSTGSASAAFQARSRS